MPRGCLVTGATGRPSGAYHRHGCGVDDGSRASLAAPARIDRERAAPVGCGIISAPDVDGARRPPERPPDSEDGDAPLATPPSDLCRATASRSRLPSRPAPGRGDPGSGTDVERLRWRLDALDALGTAVTDANTHPNSDANWPLARRQLGGVNQRPGVGPRHFAVVARRFAARHSCRRVVRSVVGDICERGDGLRHGASPSTLVDEIHNLPVPVSTGVSTGVLCRRGWECPYCVLAHEFGRDGQ